MVLRKIAPCRFVSLKDLIFHLQSSHNKNIEMAEKDFGSLLAFLAWKEGEERRSSSSYVRQCAPQTPSSGPVKWYCYYCHRSGKYDTKGASNANSERQLRFHSTKKKQMTQKRWAKPTAEERQLCRQTLEHAEARHCGICHKEDNIGLTGTVLWIQCSECGIWLHASCCPAGTEGDVFVCENCGSGGQN